MAALSVRGNFMFDAATHRDFLGACLGTGIDRRKVGDVIINGEQGAHILVVPEMIEYLTMNLTSVSLSASIHACMRASSVCRACQLRPTLRYILCLAVLSCTEQAAPTLLCIVVSLVHSAHLI